MDSSASELPNYCVIRSPELRSDYEIFNRLPDGGLQMFSSFRAKNIWDLETTRQASEERPTVDHDKHYMQQYNKNDTPTCFQVEFPFLGFSCHWSNLQDGISQWLCEINGRHEPSKPEPDKPEPLYEEMTFYPHKLFRRKLVSVPRKVCLYLAKLLELAPPMNCGCSECKRCAISSTYTITVHIDNSGNDPRPLVGASYLTLAVCDRLLVREFFCILKGSAQKCPARSYFQQIVGSTTYPDTCVYGKCYSYDVYKTEDVRMGDLDLEFFSSPGGGKDVLVVMGVDCAQGAIL